MIREFKEFNCFSQKLYGSLIFKGFSILRVRDNMKSNRKIFVFEDSKELQKVIKEYSCLKK